MKLETVYGSTPAESGIERMREMIGKDFWAGSSCELREEVPGKVWSVWSHQGTNRAGIVVVRKGKRFQFGTPAAVRA